jgi:integrase
MVAILLALASSLGYGGADFAGGLASRDAHVFRVVAAAAPAGLVVNLLLLPVLGADWSTSAVAWGAGSGLASAAAFTLLYQTLALGPMSILSPLTAVISAVIPVGVGLLEGERLGTTAALGLLIEPPTKSATLDDIRALEAGCAGDRPLDLRDRAIVSILKTTAARNSGVRLLRLEDLDFERALIRFRRGKGGKTLDVALQPETRAALVAYLERGRPLLVEQARADGDADPGWLFVSACESDGVQPLSMNAVSLMLTRRYHAGGGSLRTFGSHRIRHATATLLVNNGMPLDEVSRYLGHSSTDVTRPYARQTPDALGRRAAEAFARAEVSAG